MRRASRITFRLCLLLAFATPALAASDTTAPAAPAIAMVEPDSADAGRVIPLQGAWNVRDLGGIEGAHGAVPQDHFIRAANLAHLTPEDRDTLYSHHVMLDIDLRTPGEEHASPDALAADPHIRYLPVSLLGEKPAAMSKMPSSLQEIYLDALDNHQAAFKQIFEAIAGVSGQGAVLYHCTVGKDRTGMVSALLLELAGVSREKIVHNYAVSAYYLKPMTDSTGMSAAMAKNPALAAIMGSPPEAITVFLDKLDGHYGGAAAYLQTIGVSAGDIAKVRAQLAT
jgi:protein-tyrosine phosphatase